MRCTVKCGAFVLSKFLQHECVDLSVCPHRYSSKT